LYLRKVKLISDLAPALILLSLLISRRLC